MGATLIVNDPELAPVLSGPHLSTSEEWKARGDREIRWYDLHGESNLGRPHGSTMVYPLCYKFCFYVCFLSFFRYFFVFVFLSTETNTANLQGLTHSSPSKSSN